MVSVFVLTYNQEEFIAQTLDTIISQQTDFDFEIVIGDDASNDNTSIICERYRDKYPNLIDYKKNKVNLGLIANFMVTAKRLKGKYVAICDGDDYWTDPKKIQMQVDLLETHKEYCIVGTNSLNLFNGILRPSQAMDYIQTYGFEDMVIANKVKAPTVLFRNFEILKELPKFFLEFPYGDWPVYLILLKITGGKVAVLPAVTAVYRQQVGISAAMRLNLVNVYEKNALILEKLCELVSMKGSLKLLMIGWANQKKRQIAACIDEGSFVTSFKECCVLVYKDFKWNHLLWYLYALKKKIIQ